MKTRAKVIQVIVKKYTDQKTDKVTESVMCAVMIERDNPEEGFDVVSGRLSLDSYIPPVDASSGFPFNCIASVGFGKQKVGADGWADKFKLERVDASVHGKK